MTASGAPVVSVPWLTVIAVGIFLIPGLWLDGSSWDDVVPAVERAGHRVQPSPSDIGVENCGSFPDQAS
jgi:hypothetical protein